MIKPTLKFNTIIVLNLLSGYENIFIKINIAWAYVKYSHRLPVVAYTERSVEDSRLPCDFFIGT